MVEFGSGYFMPMDREYEHKGQHLHGHGPESGSTNDVGVSIGDLGMSLGLGPVPNVQAIKAKLYAGGKKLEFVFTGAGKGGGQGQTPEMYGKKQRKALEEISTANRVDFTTHATVGVYGLAGQDQQGNFSKTSKNFSVNEIKRAIEFAADVAHGGPVVVHTGEFHRPIIDAEWNEEEGDKWKGKFRTYEDEEGRTSWRVVDMRSGGAIAEARKNKKVSRPVWKKYEPGDEFWKEHGGNDYVDKDGNRVSPGDFIDYSGRRLDRARRIPIFNKEKGHFEVKQLGWDDLKNEADGMTNEARQFWEQNQNAPDSVWEASPWKRFQQAKNADEVKIRPEEAYIIATLETNAANSRGWSFQYSGNYDEYIETIKKLEKAKELYQKVKETTDPEEHWKLKQEAQRLSRFIPPEAKDPVDLIQDEIKELKRRIYQAQEAASSQWSQAEEAMETIKHVQSAETYALQEAFDAYARSAVFAYDHTEKLRKEGKLTKPLFLAMENLFPEAYGAHPDELIKLVKGGRERMVEILTKERGISEVEARKKAEEHINTTMDTGHLNMWRKHWVRDSKKSIQENDEEFNKWMLEKLGQMVDQKMIGHVHIDDNYGYHDDHLAPGEGNAPIKDMIELLKKRGYKGSLIVEPGADYTTDISGFHSVMKTWRLFGNQVYGTGSGVGPRRTWNEVGYGFFGQNQPPYFTFGAYVPSEDWTLWSGVPLE